MEPSTLKKKRIITKSDKYDEISPGRGEDDNSYGQEEEEEEEEDGEDDMDGTPYSNGHHQMEGRGMDYGDEDSFGGDESHLKLSSAY